jgi:uncharacterized membrane protein YqhA
MEKLFEKFLWSNRLFVLLPVLFGLLGGAILFVVASIDIIHVTGMVYSAYFGHVHPENLHADVVSGIIGAVDLYLIAVVMLIFSFGLYELFISDIDPADKRTQVLQIDSLDTLKDKLANVIIMVLLVGFFQRIIHMEFTTALEMLYFAISILGLAMALYFLKKTKKEKGKMTDDIH